MNDREKVLKGLECCIQGFSKCEICPYFTGHSASCLEKGLMPDALELLKNEPSTSTEDTSYQRLMAMNRDLIERNTNLAEEAQKLARFNDHLTTLCENLLKRLAAYERSNEE